MAEHAHPIESEDSQLERRQLVLVKRGHRYLFRYEAGAEVKVLNELIAMAADPTCNLDWFDAAVLSHQMGQRLGPQLDALLKL